MSTETFSRFFASLALICWAATFGLVALACASRWALAPFVFIITATLCARRVSLPEEL